ncbi:MAG: ABC transporter permease [Clostridia bacterium]|jgi:spermidine/putrescine transport system permease protein|nr:ABC transporter permease [Clostridia bacterium]
MKSSNSRKARWGAIPYVIWMALFTVAPLILIVIYAFSNAEGSFTVEHFTGMADYVGIFTRSLGLAAVATVISLLIGYPIAYFISKEKPSTQRFLMMLIMVPMWINFLLRTYAWMSILENTGLLNNFFRSIGLLDLLGVDFIPMINTPGAVVLGMVYNYLPFMIMPIQSVIVKLDKSLVEAAQDLGCHSALVFRKVIFPLSLPGVLSGITMVFVPCVSTFIISDLLGGGKDMLLGDLIQMQFAGTAYNPYLGSAIALVMMVIVMICQTVMNRFGEGEEQAVML